MIRPLWKKTALLAGLLTVLTTAAIAARTMPDTPATYCRPSAWLQVNSQEVIASPERIEAINHQIDATMAEPTPVPSEVSGSTLRQWLDSYKMGQKPYVKGAPLSPALASSLQEKARAHVADSNAVRYGIIVKRTDLKSFPTLLRAFDDPSDTDFDAWQVTAIDPATPVLVYLSDRDHEFFFVKASYYRGWVPQDAVALTDQATWERYRHPAEKAVVTARLYSLAPAGQEQIYQMGSTIPVSRGKLQLPTRNQKGTLTIVPVKAVYNDDLHDGPLPYTEDSLVKMAFRHLGFPYGWGGMKNSVDCSSLAQDVYRTMGIKLPRNSGEQARSFPGISLKGKTREERLAILKTLPVGSLLHMPGHVMIYLGEKNGIPYIIHSLGSYGEMVNGKPQRVPVMEVVVSPVELMGRRGKTLLMLLTKATTFR
jgi:cell wall-associated NlpC family hydrolase